MNRDAQEQVLFQRLEAVKDIKQRTVALEKIKQKLLSELNHVDAENRAIGEFKSELEQLLMEKMAHVEELRQIHADINAIELVIKQTDENRGRAADRVRRLMEDYRPLKMEVDRLRRDCLGLESLPEIESEALSDIAPQSAVEKSRHDWSSMSEREEVPTPVIMNVPPTPSSAAYLAASNHHTHLLMSALPKQEMRSIVPTGPPAFRQQPPPMKSCLSCHQQIHRNAPICPLCKAKSRSRNPKKPRKKE
ncbi:zinc finger C4H2 domain-containing protein-like [Artemia franciscana]|uniref:zinc finger C4H2 domain-containing protein-like n=1 Tax=Artemia franciscana TaxID=6661 RepID=UPI0032D9C5AB